ncbi:MAG: histidinol-phosphate transaminase [Gammaproteobacteria bacterium]|nr:histidinol-phosphate transaminase [Gammaproteobacteria bacterium]MCP5135862.1 histidinol-phosphate transaminase [Gammaproteobacteria bacterium]
MCDYRALATAATQGLTPYQPGKPISELQRELGLSDIVKLASNENPLGPGEAARTAMQSALKDVALYPDGNGFELKRAIAERFGVGLRQITLGNGSNDVLDLIARAYLGPGREAVFSEYAFAVYPISTQAVGATARVAKAIDYGHDLAAMRALVGTDTRVVFIANPNNPTGTWLKRDALRAFIADLPPDVLVVVDEAYVEYVDEAEYASALDWVAEFPNLVVTRTFSKAYALAGLRVGFAVSAPAVADMLNRVRQPFNVNQVAMVAASAALGDVDHLQRSAELNRAGMKQLVSGFAARGFGHIPSVGNFVCVDVARPAGPVFEALLREGVIVRPVGNYGMPNHLRVSIGLPDQNARLLSALDVAL